MEDDGGGAAYIVEISGDDQGKAEDVMSDEHLRYLVGVYGAGRHDIILAAMILSLLPDHEAKAVMAFRKNA